MPYKDINKRKLYHQQYIKRWDSLNREKRREIGKKSDKKRYGTIHRKKQQSDVRFRRHHRNKIKILEMYGKQCVYCGETKYECLVVDHIKDNGAEHRKSKDFKRLSVGGMYGYLAMTEYKPDLYQILCHNCNAMKQYYGVKPNGNKCKSFEDWKKLSELKYKK